MNNKYEIIEYDDILPIRIGIWPLNSFRLHWHQEMEILFVLKGSIHVMIQNETHRVSRGEIIVISPNLIHATHETEEPNVVLMLQINCGKFGFHDTQIDSTVFQCEGGEGDHPRIAQLRQCLCSVVLEMMHRRQGYQYIAAAGVQTILGVLLRSFPHQAAAPDEAVKPKDKERMDRIFDYINKHYALRIKLSDLADMEYLSVNHLSTFIRKMIGMSFGEYLNSVRMKAYLECLQADDATPVDDIAERCGFSSPQYATALFAKMYGTTPGKYRKQLRQKNAVRQSALVAAEGDAFAAVYQPTDTIELLRYWMAAEEEKQGTKEIVVTGRWTPVNIANMTERYYGSCTRIAAIGRAYEGLLAHVQDALRAARREIGFTYLRFHGLFHDDMMILKVDNTGSIHYNWRLVDTLFDFVLSIGMRPFPELTYMPTLLASGTETVFAWHGNATPPENLSAWGALVRAFVRHCVRRYGEAEVSMWWFEVWNEPDFIDVSWTGTEQEFYQFYAETARAVKTECPRARVCGPSVTSVGIGQRRWVSGFLDYCARNDVPIDMFSMHAYPEIFRQEDLYGQLQAMVDRRDTRTPACELRGQDYAESLIAAVRKQIPDGMTLPLVVTEWNLTMATFSPLNDSAFAGTALLRTALHCDAGDLDMAHWTLSDYMEEQRSLPPQELHGGFGLVTAHGIRKPTYWAVWALSRLGRESAVRMEQGIVTREGDVLTLLAYHHPTTAAAFDMAYGQVDMREKEERYDAAQCTWVLEGLGGGYRAKRYLFDARQCSAKQIVYDKGMREIPGPEDLPYLAQMAQPIRREEMLYSAAEVGGLPVTFRLSPCSFELVVLTPED